MMATFPAASLDLNGAIFSKTAAGLQEIHSRALGLPALIRRVLVLVDGKRSSKELATFAGGEEKIIEVLNQLVANGCIDVQQAPEPLADMAELAALPAPTLRSPKDVEMARDFMLNTLNIIGGPESHAGLLRAVLACHSADALRRVYPAWVSTMRAVPAVASRLPELRERLFAAL